MKYCAKRTFIVAFGFAWTLSLSAAASAQTEELDADEAGLESGAAETVAAADSGAQEAASDVGAAAAEPPKKSKGIILETEDGRFKTQIQARVQGRYEWTMLADEIDESAFSIARARMTLKGHAFEKGIKYKFQADWGKGNLSLKDFFIDYAQGGVYLRVGQFKRPFSRQQITSSGKQELIDRAITDKGFGAGRDLGVMIHNNFEKSPDIEWAVGVFNATGDGASFSGSVGDDGSVSVGKPSNVPDFFGPAIVGRVGYNMNGIKGYSDADFEGGPLRLGIAASVLAELDSDRDDDSQVLAQADVIIKASGFGATGGVYFATTQDGEGFGDQAYDRLGFHLQGGYLVNKMHQVSARFAMIAFDADVDPDMEITAGYSLYKHKHGFKWQTDAGLRSSEGTDLGDEVLVRTQLQMSF